MSTLMSRCSSPMPLRMVCPDSRSVETRNDGSSAASFANATPSFSWSAFDFGSIATSTSHSGACSSGEAITSSPPSLPLNRPRRLRRHVIHHPIDALDLVDDPPRGLTQELHVEGIKIRGLRGCHRAQAHDILVGAC